MNPIAISIKETEIGFMELNQMLQNGSDKMEISFYEAGDDKKGNGTANIIQRAIAKIKQIFERIQKRITEFFDGQKAKKQAEKLEAAMKKDPSLKNKKVKVPDNSKELKLIKETRAKVTKAKSKDEVNKIMEDYRKKKKQIIASAAVVTISVAAVAGWLLHGKNKEINNLKVSTAESEKTIKSLTKDLELREQRIQLEVDENKLHKETISRLQNSTRELAGKLNAANELAGVEKQKLGLIQVALNSVTELGEDEMVSMQKRVSRIADSVRLDGVDVSHLQRQQNSAYAKASSDYIFNNFLNGNDAEKRGKAAFSRLKHLEQASSQIASGDRTKHKKEFYYNNYRDNNF